MSCKFCIERGKPPNFGSDPQCGFDAGGFFNPKNWNCALLNKLRDIAEEKGLEYRDDMDCGSIGVVPCSGDNWCGYIVMTWYKNRGATGMAVFMDDDRAPIMLTLQIAEEAIEYWDRECQLLKASS